MSVCSGARAAAPCGGGRRQRRIADRLRRVADRHGRAAGLGRNGSGGNPATGGVPASGGSTGTGGTPASGGQTGTGGTPASGGNTGSGGAAGHPGTGGGSATGGAAGGGAGFFSDDFESDTAGKQPAGWDNIIAYNYKTTNPMGSLSALADATHTHNNSKLAVHFKSDGNMVFLERPLPAARSICSCAPTST